MNIAFEPAVSCPVYLNLKPTSSNQSAIEALVDYSPWGLPGTSVIQTGKYIDSEVMRW